MRLLPLFYRRRISGLTNVNLVVVLKLETIKPGFKSTLFCPQRQRVLPYSALCSYVFISTPKGPFACSLILDSAVRGLGESFPPEILISCDWLDIILYEFFFLYSMASHPQPLDLLFIFCFYCNLGFSCKPFPFSLYMHYQMAEDLFPPVEHIEVQFLLLC